MCKTVIRLNVKEFMRHARKKQLQSDTEIGAAIGVSSVQVWRAKLPVDDERYNAPGVQFIAGTIKALDVPFEKVFFLDKDLRGRNNGA